MARGHDGNVRSGWARSLLLPIVVFLIGIVVLGVAAYHFEENQNSVLQSKAELNAMTYSEHMRLDITQAIAVTDTLEEIIVSNDGEMKKFSKVASDMMADCIGSIQLAPAGKVTDIYPEAGNEAGKIDLIHDKDRGEICRYGRDNDVVTMQGPFDLKQGGSGIAVRNPVFLETTHGQREFWGFTIVIMRVPDVFADSVQALDGFGYDFSLSKTKMPWDDELVEVYSSGAQLRDPVSYDFEVGDTRWELNVQPKGGWSDRQSVHILLTVGVLFLLLVSGLIAVIALLRRTRRTEARTAELNLKLQETADLANAASVAKTRFINNMSHDIRTPMNAIMGYTAIAMKHDLDEKTRECLEKISESSEQLLMLINDVLDISRIESEKIAIEAAPLDIRKVAEEALVIAEGAAAGRDLKIEAKWANGEIPLVLADAVRIREVLVNVLGNAVKFTPDGGRVFFGEQCGPVQDGHVDLRYVIRDTGIGMSEEFQKHLFEEFTQERADARTQYRGTGLGMAIVKRYVEMMGGTVDVQSKQGEGTTVTLDLPLQVSDETVGRQIASEGREDQVSVESLKGARVLLAEDNDLNADVAATLLEEAGLAVTRVSDGREALNSFSSSPAGTFDVILMDIMMPVMDGLEATKAIRALDRDDAKKIPIIAMTANAFDDDARECIEAGMSAHLAKPLEIEKVLLTIAQWVKPRA